MVKNYYTRIIDTLEKKQISRAIYYIKLWAKELNENEAQTTIEQQISNKIVPTQKIEEIKDIYANNLSLILNNQDANVADETNQYATLQCYTIADLFKLTTDALNDDSKQLLNSTDSLQLLIEKIITYNHQIELQLEPNRSTYEEALDRVFNHVAWLNFETNPTELELFRKYVINESNQDFQLGKLVQPLAISALTLNILRNYSEANIIVLIDALKSPNIDVKIRAYVGVALVLATYHYRYPLFKRFSQIIEQEFLNQPQRLEKLKMVIIDLIRTLETEQLGEYMSKEIQAELIKKIPDDIKYFKIDDLTANTDWSDYENSLEHKLIQLNEMQAEGSDLQYSTFRIQKRSPFFKNKSHWFMPFDKDWSDLKGMMSNQLLNQMLESQMVCDSDCYSLCTALQYLSTNNQKDIYQFLSSQVEDEDDDNEIESFKTSEKFNSAVNKYIHNLYRFYKLNPFGEADIFTSIANYSNTIIQILYSNDFDTQSELANFYFNKNQYQPALDIYQHIEPHIATAELFQKMGYCAEKIGSSDQAFHYYTIADTFSPNNIWTLKRMIACTNDPSKLYSLYNQILQTYSNNKNALIGYARLLADQQEFKKAIDTYYQLDFLYPDTPSIETSLAQCALHLNDHATAIKYLNKVSEQTNAPADIINLGHAYMLNNDIPTALKKYVLAWDQTEKKSEFWKMLRTDEQNLYNLGLNPQTFHLINEQLILELYVNKI